MMWLDLWLRELPHNSRSVSYRGVLHSNGLRAVPLATRKVVGSNANFRVRVSPFFPALTCPLFSPTQCPTLHLFPLSSTTSPRVSQHHRHHRHQSSDQVTGNSGSKDVVAFKEVNTQLCYAQSGNPQFAATKQPRGWPLERSREDPSTDKVLTAGFESAILPVFVSRPRRQQGIVSPSPDDRHPEHPQQRTQLALAPADRDTECR